MADENYKIPVYLQIKPPRNRFYDPPLVTWSGNDKPRSPKGGQLIVKINLSIPKRAFAPLMPEGDVVVPVEDVQVVLSPDDPRVADLVEHVRSQAEEGMAGAVAEHLESWKSYLERGVQQGPE